MSSQDYYRWRPHITVQFSWVFLPVSSWVSCWVLVCANWQVAFIRLGWPLVQVWSCLGYYGLIVLKFLYFQQNVLRSCFSISCHCCKFPPFFALQLCQFHVYGFFYPFPPLFSIFFLQSLGTSLRILWIVAAVSQSYMCIKLVSFQWVKGEGLCYFSFLVVC